MELFQILNCSTLGTCCTDYGIVGILEVTKKVLLLIQFVVPFILIVAATIQFVQLTINPELKDGFRRVLNKFIAAVIIFMLPTIVDAILTATPDSFSVSACWKQVKINTNSSNSSIFGGGSYVSDDGNSSNSVLMNNEELEKLNESKYNKTATNNNSKTVSAKQKAIVSYAKQFVNKNGKVTNKYLLHGTWNGEKPYKATDCSGFVKGVYKHVTGVSIPRKAKSMWTKRSQYFDVIKEKDRQAGDIIVYGDSTGYHVGIYTGTGKEIIHNKGTSWGIIKQSNYNSASKHGKPIGFLRLKGVK